MNNDYKIIFDEKEILIRNIYCAGRNYAEHVNELNNQFPDDLTNLGKVNCCYYIATLSTVFEQKDQDYLGY